MEIATSSHRILLVDDEFVILESLQEVLLQHGFEVSIASNLAAAHDILKRQHIDVIVSDVVLPDSLETDFWALLKTERHRDIPVVFMTGYASLPSISMHQVLFKPFSELSLLSAIRAELENDLSDR